jgi:hypothetical protein
VVVPNWESILTSKREHQVTVPLDRELRESVEREAAREDRSVAAMVRRIIAEAARKNCERQEAAA